MELNNVLLRTPFECLSNAFRNAQKHVEKEVNFIVKSIGEIETRVGPNGTMKTTETVVKTLDKLISRLIELKKKLVEIDNEEQKFFHLLQVRLQHLKRVEDLDMTLTKKAQQKDFYQIQTARIIIDYLLRQGCYQTAIELAEAEKIQDFVDSDLFFSIKKVIETLRQGNCTEAIKWCTENRAKLRKINSSLEFNLRLQEFIELVKKNVPRDAILYARKNFVDFVQTNLTEIQVAMGLLVASNPTQIPKYQKLLSPERWEQLIEQFKNESYLAYGLTPESLLDIYLQAGLSSLKTWQCSDPDQFNPNCPTCAASVKELAKALPLAHHTHSALYCRATGELINENNPPSVLPNGYVYGTSGIKKMTSNTGEIICERTKEKFDISELRKVYIM